jgi:hypothetical protein
LEVAFTLAFATPVAMPDLSFFACQHHFPENFWNAAFQQHDNGVTGVARVVVTHPEPLEALSFLKAFAGGEPAISERGLDLAMANGALSIWTPDAARREIADDPIFFGDAPRFAAVIFEVRSLDKARLTLHAGNVPHRPENGRIIVPSGAAFGVLMAFEEAA